MISSVFALKEAEFIPENLVSVEETKLESGYYTNSTSKFLLEMHKELIDCKREYYRSILESGDNEYILNESFNEVISKIKVIIKKILAYIETLIKRFVTQIAKFVASDKYITKMKNELNKFTDEDKFDITGYVFTFNDNVPATDVQELNLNEIRRVLADLNDKPFEKKAVEITELITKVMSDQTLDDIRGRILGVDYPVTELNFNNEAFSVFRDGKGEESYLEIKKVDVLRAYNNFIGYKDKIKDVKRLQTKVSKEYKNIESSVDGIIKAEMKLDGASTLNSYSGSSTDYKKELSSILDKLVNQLVNNLTKIANMHTLAISAKLDALNDATVQDKKILYTALNAVQKQLKNTKMLGECVNTDYTKNLNYRQYVTEKYYIDLEQHRFINECLALSESNIPELKSINEDLKMDKKNKFEKFVQFIKSIFEKFMMKIDSYIKGNKAFLEKYKDIILNKKVPKYTLTNMPAYSEGIKNITDGSVPAKPDFSKLISETEEGIKKYIMPKYDGKGDFTEFCKRFFLCNNEENKDRDSTELNMKDIYEFCVSAPAAINNIKQDRTNFENEVKKIQAEVLKVTKEPVKESFIENLYYSSVLESYINEDGEAKPESEIKAAAPSNTDAKDGVKINFTPSKEDNNKPSDNKDIDKKVGTNKIDDKEAQKQAKENEGAEKKKVEESGEWYLKALQIVYASKLTAFQKIYSEYMKILRYHVRTATGSLGDESNFTEDDKKEIIQCMKDYIAAGDDADKKNDAANRMIAIYKSRNVVIDAHDVQSIVNSNKAQLSK